MYRTLTSDMSLTLLSPCQLEVRWGGPRFNDPKNCSTSKPAAELPRESPSRHAENLRAALAEASAARLSAWSLQAPRPASVPRTLTGAAQYSSGHHANGMLPVIMSTPLDTSVAAATPLLTRPIATTP